MKSKEELQRIMDEITEKNADLIKKDEYYEPGELTEYHQTWLQENLNKEELKLLDSYLEGRSKFGWYVSEAINWLCDRVAPKTTMDVLREEGLI